MYFKRNLEETFLKYLEAPEIIAIVGPRQSGKTTMIRHLLKDRENAALVSFDDQMILNMFEKNIEDFITAYVKGNQYLFIDEFQYAKNGGKILKYIYDTQKIKIIISGSSTIDLTVQAVKYLVGRILVFPLYPFDFQEFLLVKDKNYLKLYKKYKEKIKSEKVDISIPQEIHKKFLQYYEEYLLFGGYPRVIIEENYETKKEILRNIYNTYFLREVKDILGLIDDYKLNNLIKGLALQIGNLVQYEELSRLSEFSFPSLKKYLNFLERTYICQFIKPFYKNKRIEIVKNPKVYFFDTGLRNVIVNDFRKLNERPDGGTLLENGLAMHFIKSGRKINFWRDKKKNEIDFVIPLENGKSIAIESKSYLKDALLPNIKIFKKLYPEIKVIFSYQDLDKKIKKKRTCPIYLF
ncbi:MAG: ATP-binding protein [Patescibacteria group bacterium]